MSLRASLHFVSRWFLMKNTTQVPKNTSELTKTCSKCNGEQKKGPLAMRIPHRLEGIFNYDPPRIAPLHFTMVSDEEHNTSPKKHIRINQNLLEM